MQLTQQQTKAIESAGKTIVSASAGSGKTFVMIQKLISAIEGGADLDSVLAVTFTKKAAAQMKEKLRKEIIARMRDADGETRSALKAQLSKIPSADISTIHSFCARLIRTYFYAVGVDATFDIISSDDARAREFKQRALDEMFDGYYETDDENFRVLLSCYRRKRGDAYLKNLILSCYEELRINDDYEKILQVCDGVYTDGGFERVAAELTKAAGEKYSRLASEVKRFAQSYYNPRPEYAKILKEMIFTLENSVGRDIFSPQPPLCVTRKPADRTEADREASKPFKDFKDGISARYKAIRGDISDRQTEKELFLKSGAAAKAFSAVLCDFDGAYTRIKRDENKLDYNDLEHLTVRLLRDNADIRRVISEKYKYVFVDEYQDVNPVQETIVSLVGGKNVFLVGDLKQAIYGFRGSKSDYFARTYASYGGGGSNALKLSNNFRSSDGVLDFVNGVFSKVMTRDSCGLDYSGDGLMVRGGGYPSGYGSAEIHIFGEDEKDADELEIYSVRNERGIEHTREARAVVNIVEKELRSRHFDLKTGETVETKAGDICILTRKRNKNAAAIVRALQDRGYSVSGAQETNLTSRPEVRLMLDILSYLDNKQQDIPLATALLSPLGSFTCDELARIRTANKGAGRVSFRECCRRYLRLGDPLAQKLSAFRKKIEYLRDLTEIFSAEEIIDKILEDTRLEAEYSAGGGEKLKNICALAAEGKNISVSALLAKLKNGYEITSPSAAGSDSIKIMTMHASKGLEFPVVIISDICATFRGRDASEMPLHEAFGFAPKYFDKESMLAYDTVLRRLIKERSAREELKNELNLFYVACTRAMCNLHILAKEITPYNGAQTADANCYSKLFDMSGFPTTEADVGEREETAERAYASAEPDEKLYSEITPRFFAQYRAADSVNLPVKSSASAILKMNGDDSVCTHAMFGGEGETGTERGIAYHRFLELCDFGVRDAEGIEREIEGFYKDGLISEEQRELLDKSFLEGILAIPVFSKLGGAVLYREKEFLCELPANELFETTATDKVLIQGAIDLLVKRGNEYCIIDYKYSKKTAEQLISTYSRQLSLYKKAVALITGADAEKIGTVIINIYAKEQIIL